MSPPEIKLRIGRKMSPTQKFTIQLSERATDDREDTAFAGDTSGIITKGIGPRPTAKDITNVTIATLGRIEAPEFSPQPTAKSETRAPNVEILRSCFVPKRSISKIGGKVMITLMIVIVNDIYGPKRGRDFARMSLLR